MPDTQNYTFAIVYECIKTINNLSNTELLLDDLLLVLKKYQFNYTSIKFIDPITEEIIIRHATGLPEESKRKVKYKIGEGLTGKVVQEGKPIVIRRIGDDNRFLNKTGIKHKDDNSFYCYPIEIKGKTIGALSAIKYCDRDPEHDANVELFTTLMPLLSQYLQINKSFQVEQKKLQEENQNLRFELKQKKGMRNFVGNSSKMHALYEQIRLVANSNATILITGENGTGKELIADAIHYSSPRMDKPFVKVNCAALPESLLESELFGHEKGAFTGAAFAKKGRFELANGGTLFLDEIGEINQNIQVKLLRVLQNREFERVGGVKTLQTDVRIIAATNKNLEEEIKQGNFREDLYYRLNVFPILSPPLRERKTDITLLAEYFLDKYSKENGKNIRRISTPAIDMLMSYHWPGNVRELENCLERSVLLCQTDTIRAQDLPPTLQVAEPDEVKPTRHDWTLPQAVANLEKEMIIEYLKRFSGHQGKAAIALGITERQIGYKMIKYHISKKMIKG